MSKSSRKIKSDEKKPLSAPGEWLNRYQPPRTGKANKDLQPYLSILNVAIYVEDQEKSFDFYTQKLGFQTVAKKSKDSDSRWVAVAPPDGSVVLALLEAPEDSAECARIGTPTGVTFGSENIEAQFKEWTSCGVRFTREPTPMKWGILANFLDLDNNEFALIQSPWFIDLLNTHRRIEEERKAAERRRLIQMNEELEERVNTRTRELQQANRDLLDAQAQLVQSSKMASLGMLAAGIAHEINTPVGTIHSNADVERRAVEAIRKIISDLEFKQEIMSSSQLDRTLKILEDVNRSTLAATGRVSKVVQSLKNFARLDQAEIEQVDLHEGLDSTLTLMDHLLKDRIKVTRNYGTLPKVRCYVSQINQVFANIITNAAQAIEQQGNITITTLQENSQAIIRLADDGSGILAEHLSKIFDPGFTTKGVRVGIGLGLSIAYRIIEMHKGTIEVDSKPGQGAVFTIRLPIAVNQN